MAKSDLLKEAIADANAVKETALANAKIALQEAFAPRLERMLKDKLQMEVEGEEDVDMEATPELDADAEMNADVEAGADMEAGDDFNWIDSDLSAEVGGNTYDFEVGMSGDEEELDMDAEEEMPAEEPAASGEYDEMEEDLNLEQIIRELEASMPEDEMMMGDEEGIATEGEYKMPADNELSEEEDFNIDEIIESILREEDEMEEPEEDVKEGMEAELEAKEEELQEAYRTVKQLKNILSEVNLLNAKLLYTNKLFRNFELSENQKMKVIENFDRAGNTREVKLVFSTLAESFNRPTKKRVVKESYASKPVATTAPKKETTQVLSEGFELANRWKKLAGLL